MKDNTTVCKHKCTRYIVAKTIFHVICHTKLNVFETCIFNSPEYILHEYFEPFHLVTRRPRSTTTTVRLCSTTVLNVGEVVIRTKLIPQLPCSPCRFCARTGLPRVISRKRLPAMMAFFCEYTTHYECPLRDHRGRLRRWHPSGTIDTTIAPLYIKNFEKNVCNTRDAEFDQGRTFVLLATFEWTRLAPLGLFSLQRSDLRRVNVYATRASSPSRVK